MVNGTCLACPVPTFANTIRSEEHTSELQSTLLPYTPLFRSGVVGNVGDRDTGVRAILRVDGERDMLGLPGADVREHDRHLTVAPVLGDSGEVDAVGSADDRRLNRPAHRHLLRALC